MSGSEQSIVGGHFAKKQLFSKSWLISWSHRSRFHVALELAREFAGKRLLDYGCGDGSFLAMLMETPHAPSLAVGAEVDPRVLADCRDRVDDVRRLSFIESRELDSNDINREFDAIVCMEVLEHVLDPASVINKFASLLSPSGKLLLSVPVETGLPLLVKQSVRRIAGWRGIGDYPGTGSYTLAEFAKSIVATGNGQHIVRPIHTNPDGSTFHDHKGFNWMLLKKRLEQDFEIERMRCSPLKWAGPHFASQVWFVARKK